jgi:hypothetical protein
LDLFVFEELRSIRRICKLEINFGDYYVSDWVYPTCFGQMRNLFVSARVNVPLTRILIMNIDFLHLWLCCRVSEFLTMSKKVDTLPVIVSRAIRTAEHVLLALPKYGQRNRFVRWQCGLKIGVELVLFLYLPERMIIPFGYCSRAFL